MSHLAKVRIPVLFSSFILEHELGTMGTIQLTVSSVLIFQQLIKPLLNCGPSLRVEGRALEGNSQVKRTLEGTLSKMIPENQNRLCCNSQVHQSLSYHFWVLSDTSCRCYAWSSRLLRKEKGLLLCQTVSRISEGSVY